MKPLPDRLDSVPKTQSRFARIAILWWIALVFLTGLACGQATAGPPSTVRISRLPTLTPTSALEPAAEGMTTVIPSPLPTATPPLPVAAEDAAAPVTVPANNAPPPPPPAQTGWDFVAVRQAAELAGLRLTGELLNNTAQPQAVQRVTGTFYNAQGQVVAGPDSSQDHRPLDIVPPGGRMPFSLTAPGIHAASDFDLAVIAGPGNLTPRQDFQFVGLEPSIQADDYCQTGQMQNPGSALQSQLVIALLLYDDQGNLINFSSYNELYFADVLGDQLLDFEVCVPPPNQAVARDELRAWGW